MNMPAVGLISFKIVNLCCSLIRTGKLEMASHTVPTQCTVFALQEVPRPISSLTLEIGPVCVEYQPVATLFMGR